MQQFSTLPDIVEVSNVVLGSEAIVDGEPPSVIITSDNSMIIATSWFTPTCYKLVIDNIKMSISSSLRYYTTIFSLYFSKIRRCYRQITTTFVILNNNHNYLRISPWCRNLLGISEINVSIAEHDPGFPWFEENNFNGWLIQFKAHLRKVGAHVLLDVG